MKAKYDFSNAQRGKFYRPDAELLFPIYLEPDVEKYVTELAKRRKVDVESFVNEWLRANIKLLRSPK
jgi:hypothetical protein